VHKLGNQLMLLAHRKNLARFRSFRFSFARFGVRLKPMIGETKTNVCPTLRLQNVSYFLLS